MSSSAAGGRFGRGLQAAVGPPDVAGAGDEVEARVDRDPARGVGELLRQERVVGVEIGDVRRAGGVGAGVAGMIGAARAGADEARAQAGEGGGDSGEVLGRAVVDDDGLEVAEALPVERGERAGQEARAVAAGHDDAECRASSAVRVEGQLEVADQQRAAAEVVADRGEERPGVRWHSGGRGAAAPA